MTDLTALLSKNSDDVKPPSQLPPGTFMFRVTGYKSDRKSAAGNPAIDFDVEALSALDGVEQSQMEGIELPLTMRHTFYLTEKSLFRLRDFCKDALGVPSDGRSLKDILDDTPGRAFRGNVTHRPNSNDPTRFYAEISEVFPAE